MKAVSAFTVKKFTNSFGKVVSTVLGYLCGQRVRENFAARAKAEAEK